MVTLAKIQGGSTGQVSATHDLVEHGGTNDFPFEGVSCALPCAMEPQKTLRNESKM
jgi:hypothetical protein